MDSKIMQVFYGNDCLPYKDKERTVHYPIIGNTFTGANNTTQIRFYVGLIGNDSAQWVAATQRPKGQAGYELLSTKVYDDEVGEYYYVLDLNSWYTQYKGDIYISLHGYNGGVLIEQDPDTGIYEISGTPTIQTTGAIKIAINYAPQVLPVAEIPLDTLQDILGAISEKVDFQNTIYAAPNIITSLNMADYANGQIFYDTSVKKFYFNNNGTLTYIEIDSAIHQYDYNLSTTLQIVYNQVGINKLFYAKLDNRWQLLMLQETSGNYSFVFWDELGYGQTDTIQDLSENIENFTFHYTGSYLPYVEKNSLGETLTDDELAILSQPNSVFIYNYSIHGLTEKTATTLRFRKNTDFYSTSGGQLVFRNQYITVSLSAKTYSVNVSEEETYKDDKINTLLNLKEDLANKTTTITSSSNDTQYPSAKAVYDFTYDRDYIDTTFATKSELTRVYKYEGSAAVNTLNNMTKTSQMNGYVYNMSTSGNLVNEDNSTISVSVGDNVSFVWQNGDWYWDKMAGSIDLSGYVEKTTTIAGINLEDNITKNEIGDAITDDIFVTTSNNPVKNSTLTKTFEDLKMFRVPVEEDFTLVSKNCSMSFDNGELKIIVPTEIVVGQQASSYFSLKEEENKVLFNCGEYNIGYNYYFIVISVTSQYIYALRFLNSTTASIQRFTYNSDSGTFSGQQVATSELYVYPTSNKDCEIVYKGNNIQLYIDGTLATTLNFAYENKSFGVLSTFLSSVGGSGTNDKVLMKEIVVSSILTDVQGVYGRDNSTPISQKFASIELQKARSEKIFHFSLDDFIVALKDITDNVSTYTSIFDNSLFAYLKGLHDDYGCCVSLYCFYEDTTLNFNLSQCTSSFANEFQANSSWLKFGFHGRNINSNYSSTTAATAKSDYDDVITQLMRITGSIECIDRCPRISSYTGNLVSMKAFRDTDCGIVGALTAMNADETTSRDSYYFDADQNDYIAKHCKYVDSNNQLTFFKTSYNTAFGTSNYINNVAYANLRNYIIIFSHENQMTDGMKTAYRSAIGTFYKNGFVSDFPMNHCLNY